MPVVERYACPSWRLAAVTSTSRLASASPTRAGFERLGLRGVLVTSSPAKHQRAVLTCRESPVASSASRCAWMSGSSAGGSQDAAARAAPGLHLRSGQARSAAHIGGERTSACGWSVSLSLLAVPCPSALLRSCSHSHPQNAHRCRSRSCVLSRKASVGVAIDCRAKMSPADNAVGRAAVQAPPHGVGALVPRRELFDVLGRARRVVQVSAPAGSGKTSLLRSWIAEAELRDSVAWVSVAAKERDPQRFWLSVLDAVRATKAGSSLVGELTPAPDLDGGAIVERLLADLSPLDEPIWLVIDDLHELCSDDAFRQLELLLMRAPAVLRFVLLSRRELRLGLHRLRLEGELTEIRAADLRFSLDESRALFESAGVQLSESGVALLAERTEGWAAGLRLAALSLAGHHDAGAIRRCVRRERANCGRIPGCRGAGSTARTGQTATPAHLGAREGQRAAGRFVDGRVRRATGPAGVGGGGRVCGLAGRAPILVSVSPPVRRPAATRASADRSGRIARVTPRGRHVVFGTRPRG